MIEFILNRVRSARRSGKGWIAACPAHEDRSPSLSINERDGRVLLYCHAGCSIEAICAALGINISELFSRSSGSSKQEPPLVRALKREIAMLRPRLTPRDRERPVTVILVKDDQNADAAFARALALAVEGELVQVAFARGAK